MSPKFIIAFLLVILALYVEQNDAWFRAPRFRIPRIRLPPIRRIIAPIRKIIPPIKIAPIEDIIQDKIIAPIQDKIIAPIQDKIIEPIKDKIIAPIVDKVINPLIEDVGKPIDKLMVGVVMPLCNIICTRQCDRATLGVVSESCTQNCVNGCGGTWIQPLPGLVDEVVPDMPDDESVESQRSRYFDGLDTNGDGYVGLEEFAQKLNKTSEDVKPTFDLADLNSDGLLDRDEFINASFWVVDDE